MTTEIHRIPVISTAHLTKEVADRLTKERNDNPWCPCIEWEYGFVLYLGDTGLREVQLPECLNDIAVWLHAMQYDDGWVRLDSSADIAPDLAYYDW